jgi:nucleotide-binding universal stress UspA family protein
MTVSVIVGYLSSKRGRAALDLAVSEARLRNTDLVVVHSIHGGARSDDDEVVTTDRELRELDARLAAEGIEFSIHNYVRGNSPAKDLMLAVEEHGGELVVIGLRKRSQAGKFLLGSNAHDILMESPVPVITVRAE